MAIKAVVDTLDDVPEEFHSLYSEKNGKFEVTGIEGIKTQADVDRLNEGLRKERKDHAALREKFSIFGDESLEDIRAKLDKYPELEAAASGKVDEEQLNKMVETRLGSKLAPVQRELEAARKELKDKALLIEGFTAKERSRLIADAVRRAAKESGMLESAVDDAILLAERTFELDEAGNVVTKDNVGVTPGVDAKVWLSDLQPKRAHWWAPSQGGGAGGQRNGGQNGSNPFSNENWNLTEQGRLYKENPTRAEQMAKAAGTTIGGRRPAPKK